MRHIQVPCGEAIPLKATGDGTVDILVWDGIEDYAAEEQFRVLLEALKKYVERNVEYNDNWRRMGWRGMLVRVRERAERLWDSLWNARPSSTLGSVTPATERKLDDAIDAINFLGFLIRAVRAGNRDGSWWDGI